MSGTSFRSVVIRARSQVLEFSSEGNILSAKDNIGGGSVDVFLSHGTCRNEHCLRF
jgi:hypothetical protein